ncbi:hypothetical protein ABMY20_12765 [Tenacibaculum sp. SSH1-16]|uniref:hypothetical protein n=1 Tax=Tenacibaculum sp. SSH1-16 TaxID=3136667 RepID=UPI0032C45B06
MKTVIYFLTYKLENGIEGSRMSEWQVDFKTDVKSHFYKWCVEQQRIVEKEQDSLLYVKSINLIE